MRDIWERAVLTFLAYLFVVVVVFAFFSLVLRCTGGDG